MPALAGAADLAAICACVLYLALLLTASWLVGVLLGFTNISILGTHPLKNIATGALNAINKGLQDQIVATQTAISTLWSGFTWLIKEGGNAIASLSGATYGTFHYLRNTVIPPLISGALGPAETLAQDAANAAKSAGDTATSAGASIKTEVASALKTAENYTDSAITTAHKYVDTQVAAGVSSAGITAGQLVGQATALITKDYNELLGDFDSVPAEVKAAVAGVSSGISIGDVTGAIQQALAAGGSIYNEISSRIVSVGGSVTEADITNAISAALNPGASIYNEIKSLTPSVPGGLTIGDVTNAISSALAAGGSIANAIAGAATGVAGGVSETDVVNDITNALLPTGAIGLAIAEAVAGIAIPVPPGGVTIPTPTIAQITAGLGAVTAAVAGIEAISFIGGQDCQNKVGNICSTDATRWASLLEGLVTAGLTFSLAELVEVAGPIVTELAPVIAQAA